MTDPRKLQEMNMVVVRRLREEGFGQGMVRRLPDQIATDYVGHLPNGDHYGPEGVRIDIDGYRAILADFSVTVDDLFADADKVACRFTLRGTVLLPFSSNSIEGTEVVLSGIAIDRLADGCLVESWVQIQPPLWEL
jgi:predicted ester cyclase